jgi:hypothetical protein
MGVLAGIRGGPRVREHRVGDAARAIHGDLMGPVDGDGVAPDRRSPDGLAAPEVDERESVRGAARDEREVTVGENELRPCARIRCGTVVRIEDARRGRIVARAGRETARQQRSKQHPHPRMLADPREAVSCALHTT